MPKLPCVTLGSPIKSTAEVDLSGIEPLQSYSLSSSGEENIFTSAESISSFVQLLNEFADKAMQPGYHLGATVDFHDRSQISADLAKAY